MRLSFMAQDILLFQHEANRTARAMAKPTVGALNRLKRAARYMIGHGRRVQVFVEQDPVSWLDVYCDSDWAKDAVDRKSVSCAIAMRGSHCLKSRVSTQTAPALSSGEAEYVA